MNIVKTELRDEAVRLTFRDASGDTFTEDISIALWEQICELNRADRRAAGTAGRQKRRRKMSVYIEGAYDLYAPETAFDPVGDVAVENDCRRIILGMIDSMSETQRRQLLAYCVEGLTYQQVAEREGVAYSRAYRSIRQTLEILREIFE